jgi:hypothetical protein
MNTDTKSTVTFIKHCLKDEGYSKELIAYLMSTYDLETFIGQKDLNRYELTTRFLAHARQINVAGTEF